MNGRILLNLGLLVALGSLGTLRLAQGFCWEPGRHPGFRGPPRIEQVRIDRVRLDWRGLVTKAACVDNFVVKYWQRLDAREYKVGGSISRSGNNSNTSTSS